MYTFDEVADILDDLVDALPDELLKDLTGIYLEPDVKHNDKIPSDDYYVMGTYHRTPYLGNSISIYYGSIMAMYANVDRLTLTDKLRCVLDHELRHHVEALAGCDDLIVEDNVYVRNAIENLKNKPD